MAIICPNCMDVDGLAAELTALPDDALIRLIIKLDYEVSDLQFTKKVHRLLSCVIEEEEKLELVG